MEQSIKFYFELGLVEKLFWNPKVIIYNNICAVFPHKVEKRHKFSYI